MTPLDFALLPASSNEPCAGFVARWLNYRGVSKTPSPSAIRYAWHRNGIAQGVAIWCNLIGLEPCAPEANAVALAEQEGGDLIVGVLTAEGWFVTRSFGAVARLKPKVIACWRIPTTTNV
ncbi:MAG: hypothetical protein FJX45_10405 [Alphaproteobacteria bacterium]|nr:hypothetical protein [Alphaproteobacteria bacterium]MBM3654750.1 hypothetical protein [Alphaproteobacteria bacterium]